MVNGWHETPVKDLMRIETGGRNTEDKIDDGQYPFFVRSQTVEHIDSFHYDCEAVLTAGDGVGTGKVFHYVKGKFDAHQRVYVMSQFKDVLGKYFYYWFSQNFYAEVAKYTAKTSVDSVRRQMIAEMIMPIPSIPEQERIVSVLSDVDALITDLQKLLQKKKDIRQGTMQMLVTGKKRLDGFDGNWQTTTLDKLCRLVTKQTGFDYSAEIKPSLVTAPQIGTIPFIQNKDFEAFDINYNTDFYIPYDVAKKYPKILLDEVCLLISISGRIGNVAVFDNKQMAFAGGAVGIAKLFDPNLASWCMLYLSGREGQEQIFSNEKVGAQHNLTVADVRKLEIKLPEKPERDAIIGILTDMDGEIKLLTEKLQKYQKVKSGMMEELLTGKVRLI